MLDALQDLLHPVCGTGLSPWGAALDAQWPWPYALGLLKGAEYEAAYPGAEETRHVAWKLYSALASHSRSSINEELKRVAW
jgi:hypothetical protein